MPIGSKKTQGGHAAGHPTAAVLPVYAATTTNNEKTVIREELQTIACWRLNDVRFDFGSSFVGSEAQPEFENLRMVCDAYPGAPLTVYGHADPIGDDEFNKILSGRRAEAIYAVITHDVARWEKLYSNPPGGDYWGLKHTQMMLTALGYDPGTTSGSATSQSTDAIRRFQDANALTADGAAGPMTRGKLFEKYFLFLFPRKLEKSAFLGQGQDSSGKADYQGCGEFNPAMVFSQSEAAEFVRTGNYTLRNEENGVNRRVLVLFFRPGTFVRPDKWPCPRATEGTSSCRKRLWSDGEFRRSQQTERRDFPTISNTFACRFYHRLTENSPCEGIESPLVAVEIFLEVPQDNDGVTDDFELLSTDGSYRHTLPRSAAVAQTATRCILIFTEVVVGLSYTLNHYPVLNVKSVIFDAVPFELLDDLGGAPGNPRVVLPAKYAGEPKPKLPTSDPLIVDNPVDEQTPHERYEDPHTSNTAME